MVNKYASDIQLLLEPLVGAFVAKMAVNFQCKSLGITPEEIGPNNLDQLAERIGKALEMQGKADVSRSMVEKIKALK